MNTTHELKTALDKFEGIGAALARERKFLDDAAAESRALVKTVEVTDPKQLARIGDLLTIEQVGPARRTRRLEEQEHARVALVEVADRFSRTVLAPRFRQIESQALAGAEERLRDHFTGADDLRAAALRSTEIAELSPILEVVGRATHNYSDGQSVVRHARALIEAWAALDAFEAKHLAT
jgi:hypothetical protein